MKIISIVGARPQFIKIAPLANEIVKRNEGSQNIEHIIIHTGQHYDYNMNKIFFDELGIPEPDYNLEVGSASHGVQTGEILIRTEEALQKEKPDFVIVYGDTNSTLGGTLAAIKLHIPVAHIEAGLRSFNRRMPEEINRCLTDHSAILLFCPTKTSVVILGKEGIGCWDGGRLYDPESGQFPEIDMNTQIAINTGDIMCGALLLSMEIAEKKSRIIEDLKLEPKAYYLATVHRAENTDDSVRLKQIVEALIAISAQKPVIFPVHVRTQRRLESQNILPSDLKNLSIIEPVGYFDMLLLEKSAYKILTDSGGVQKEAYLQKVPCVTLRDETEWLETLSWRVDGTASQERTKKAS